MLEQTLIRKPQQVREMKSGFGSKGKAADEVTIPDSWNLNELQRNFIESMIDKKSK